MLLFLVSFNDQRELKLKRRNKRKQELSRVAILVDAEALFRRAEVAQLVEHPPEERGVVSSSLTLGIYNVNKMGA